MEKNMKHEMETGMILGSGPVWDSAEHKCRL